MRYSHRLVLICLIFSGSVSHAQQYMRANLSAVVSNTEVLLDGNLTEYSSSYSNNVDYFDALKLTNFGSNFGIQRQGYTLVVERRADIRENDTCFFRMWNMSQGAYRIKLTLSNLESDDRKVIFQDAYLKTETEIPANAITNINFTITSDALSAGQTRFRLVYAYKPQPPVYLGITATKSIMAGRRDVNLKWTVSNEKSVETYTVEHSTTGNDFTAMYQLNPLDKTAASNNYSYNDAAATAGDHYYRIKATITSGAPYYSDKVKVNVDVTGASIVIYPNPVMNKTVYMQFNNFAAGRYEIALVYNNGAKQLLSPYIVVSGQGRGSINLPPQLASGNYRLEFTGPDNQKLVKTITVL
jgi:hypothetical protein